MVDYPDKPIVGRSILVQSVDFESNKAAADLEKFRSVYRSALIDYSGAKTTQHLHFLTKRSVNMLKLSMFFIGSSLAVKTAFYLWYRLEYDINILRPKASPYLKNRLS